MSSFIDNYLHLFFSSRQLFPDDEPEEEEKIQEICQSFQTISCTDRIPSPTKEEEPTQFFYDFQPENFHAEQVCSSISSILILFFQGAPYVCTTCNGVGHLKSECPELIVPKMIDLPDIHEDWIRTLSVLCQQITGRRNDIFVWKE